MLHTCYNATNIHNHNSRADYKTQFYLHIFWILTITLLPTPYNTTLLIHNDPPRYTCKHIFYLGLPTYLATYLPNYLPTYKHIFTYLNISTYVVCTYLSIYLYPTYWYLPAYLFTSTSMHDYPQTLSLPT